MTDNRTQNEEPRQAMFCMYISKTMNKSPGLTVSLECLLTHYSNKTCVGETLVNLIKCL